ncbi:hypothetical protein M0811_00419 [Anaeramoeba ignava]|uniref:IPT/TIG domain-containing protein n=1 Tax=Anaeramoeba ignava TaxID=1746090 RepID=A0A9Q0RFV0_ANAIG|nr:hypothetical protein M0811_00419 [Anaeramoeba ignava]
MKEQKNIIKYITIILLIANISLGYIPVQELKALEDLYNSTNGLNWKNSTNWMNLELNPCGNWFGVECDSENTHVSGLFLSNNNLTGQLPESFSDFSFLTEFDFGHNNLNGKFPEVPNTLIAISLRENKLSGALPDSLGLCENISFIHLDFNSFDSEIPETFSKCSNIIVFSLTNNSLTGNLPVWLFENNKQLSTLMFGGNSLTGSLPDELSEPLLSLHVLDLSGNQLSGKIPDNFNSLFPNLHELNLFGNSALEGEIPSTLSTLSSLVILDVHSNNMGNEIPSELFLMKNLDYLCLQNNHFSGHLPDTGSNTPIIDLSNNIFFCPLPEWTNDLKIKITCQNIDLLSIVLKQGTVAGGTTITLYGEGIPNTSCLHCLFVGDLNVTVPAAFITTHKVACITPAHAAGTVKLTLSDAEGVPVTDNFFDFTFVDPNSFSQKKQSNSPKCGTTFFSPHIHNEDTSSATVADSLPEDHTLKSPRRETLDSLGNTKVIVNIFGEALCPDFKSIEEIFLPIQEDIGDIFNLQIGFIGLDSPNYPTGFWSLHGQSELIGDEYQACAFLYYTALQGLQFADCMNKDQSLVPTNALQCASETGLNPSVLFNCVFEGQGKQLVAQSISDSIAFSVVWSPTIFINDQFYCLWHSAPCKASSPDDFKQAICDAYYSINNFSSSQSVKGCP